MNGFCGEDRPLRSVSLLNPESYPELLKKHLPPPDLSEEDKASPQPREPPLPEYRPFEFRILVTKSEILDKGKSDELGKFFTILQTMLFVVQYLLYQSNDPHLCSPQHLGLCPMMGQTS
jgi:hypothetical protein